MKKIKLQEDIRQTLTFINNLKKGNNIADYDIKLEYINLIKKYMMTNSPIERVSFYKNVAFDADVSLFSVVIYKLAYKYIKQYGGGIDYQDAIIGKYKILLDNGIELIGDTMNSFTTSVNEYLRRTYQFPTEWDDWESYLFESSDKVDTSIFSEFAKVNHTIGNFIPVPKEFNFSRSFLTKDFWDITLLRIWQWYLSGDTNQRNNELLKKIIGGKNQLNNVNICSKWLNECFKDWDDFIEKNYLKSFVSGSYNRPIELWDGHLYDDKTDEVIKNIRRLPVKLSTKGLENKQFEQFFSRATDAIKIRGNTIVKEL